MRQKKTGIMTFHRATNYGAVLQTYALYKTVENLGAECKVIDYRCPKIEYRRKYIRYEKNAKIKSIIHSILTMDAQYKKRKCFQRFVDKYIPLSEKVESNSISKIKNQYEIFISGSDQVFSPTCVDFDENYFLTFADAKQKYSYAASFGTSTIAPQYQDEMKKRLQDFSNISVRESSGKAIVEELAGKKAQVNIDPSLLLNASQWQEIEAKPQSEEKYIFMFRVNKPIHMMDFALKLAKEKGLKIIFVSDSTKNKDNVIEYIKSPSIEEFLSYIHHAEYVITNSFHATAFSVIFNKKLFVELETQTGRNNRAEELLRSLKIDGREIKEDVELEGAIDWDTANALLEKEREKAIHYLKGIVEE